MPLNPPVGVRTADRFSAGTADLPITGTVAKSAAFTTAQDFFLDNEDGRGLIVVVNMTAVSGAGSLVFTVQGYDPASNTVYPILSSVAVVAPGQTILQVSPDLTAVANLKANSLLPEQVVIHVAVATADSMTYSIGAVLTP